MNDDYFTNQILTMKERVVTGEHRLMIANDVRENYLYDKNKALKKIKELFVAAFQDDVKRESLNEIYLQIDKEINALIEANTKELKALNTINNVVNHPMHMQKILSIYKELPAEIRAPYDGAISECANIYYNISKKMTSFIIPLVQKQMQLLLRIKTNKSIKDLLEYIDLSNQTKMKIYNDAKEIRPAVRGIHKLVGLTRKGMKKIAQFDKAHAYAMALFFMATMVVGEIIPEEEGAVIQEGSLLLSLARGAKIATEVSEGVLLARDSDLALNEIMEHFESY